MFSQNSDGTWTSPNMLSSLDKRIQGDEIVFDNGQRINWKNAFTKDTMFTLDQYTKDTAGAFLIGELERLDQQLHEPLVSVTWGRDVDLREDVAMADESSSFTQSTYASAGGINPAGKSWMSKDSNATTGQAVDIGKIVHPLYQWGQEIKYTLTELASAQQVGRPIDVQKYDAMKMKYQMDIDEMVYIGDTYYAQLGLTNYTVANGATAQNSVTAANVAVAGASSPTGNSSSTKWIDKTANAILADVNTLLESTWAASGYAVMPTSLRVPPAQLGYLVSQLVSGAGNVSILEFLRNNSLCNTAYGVPLDIQAIKWLPGRGAGGTDRMMCYTKDRDRVRYPLVPLQRTPLEWRGIWNIVTYFGKLGVLEWVYPETAQYADGL